MNKAGKGLSTSSWSRTTGPMCLVSFAGGEYLYLYQIEFTLGVHVYLLAKVKLDHLSSMGAQVWDNVSGQQSVHTCIWGTMSAGCLLNEYMCAALHVFVSPCVSVSGTHDEQTGKQQLCPSVWAETLGSQTLN